MYEVQFSLKFIFLYVTKQYQPSSPVDADCVIGLSIIVFAIKTRMEKIYVIENMYSKFN